MKDIKAEYTPVEAGFRADIENYRQARKYIRIHYFNDYHEYISTAAIIKQIEPLADGEFLELSSGEWVRLDKIVRLNGEPAPGYQISDFTCDC